MTPTSRSEALVSRVLMGTDPRMRVRTRPLLASVLYLGWICVISLGIEAGLFISACRPVGDC